VQELLRTPIIITDETADIGARTEDIGSTEEVGRTDRTQKVGKIEDVGRTNLIAIHYLLKTYFTFCP
jgi:hypothetical protein